MRRLVLGGVLFILCASSPLFAATLKEFSFYTGRGIADIREKGDYEVVILGLRFGFDMNPLFRNRIKGLFTFNIEPFLSPVINPDNNLEFGCHFMLRYGYRWEKFMPYVEAGTGFMYTTQHVREQGTQWNFSSQGGVGFYYFFKDDLALNIGYRYRHFSNLSVEEPNGGVDLNNVIVGISWFFD